MSGFDILMSCGAGLRLRIVLCTVVVLAAVNTISIADDERGTKPDGIQKLLEKAGFVIGANAEKPATLSDQEIRRIADYYRSKYPFKSLLNRLAYERGLAAEGPKPKLNKKAAERLALQENPEDIWEDRTQLGQSMRAKSLALLHSNKVRQFVTQEGFGRGRMLPPGPIYLDLPELVSVSFDQPPTLSAAHLDERHVPLLVHEPASWQLLQDDWKRLPHEEWDQLEQQRYDIWIQKNNPLQVPTRSRLLAMHRASLDNFAGLRKNGYVRSVDHVAGFAPHALSFIPRPKMRRPQPNWMNLSSDQWAKLDAEDVWLVSRLQLVSLLKHEEPGAYISDHLPRMAELVDAKTRPLDKFEAVALKRLREGEDLVTQSRTNRILMLGSLRAAKQCLGCHDVHHGELLGAFSYELIRNNSIVLHRTPLETIRTTN